MQIKELEELIQLIERSEIEEFELERSGTKIKIRKSRSDEEKRPVLVSAPLGPETPAQDVSAYVAQGDIDAVALSIIVDENLDKAEECVSSMMALEQPPLILLGGPAVQKQEDLFSQCHIVTDFSDAMDTLDDILGIPTGGQSLSHMLDGIGENIQKTRTARGMNQGELANQAGVDRAYISLVENGKQNLTMSALVKLADALSIPVSSIIPNDNYRR